MDAVQNYLNANSIHITFSMENVLVTHNIILQLEINCIITITLLFYTVLLRDEHKSLEVNYKIRIVAN